MKVRVGEEKQNTRASMAMIRLAVALPDVAKGGLKMTIRVSAFGEGTAYPPDFYWMIFVGGCSKGMAMSSARAARGKLFNLPGWDVRNIGMGLRRLAVRLKVG